MPSDSSSAPTPSPSRSFSRSAGMRSSSHSATPPFCLLQCCASVLPSCRIAPPSRFRSILLPVLLL
ncbi:uncharacterized protein DS421_13g427320 [Arachis hypogaea]|nr:uncharacterized protein DS421_13g427320 [Arachis hypogaea]